MAVRLSGLRTVEVEDMVNDLIAMYDSMRYLSKDNLVRIAEAI
jgi:hypothetical protein